MEDAEGRTRDGFSWNLLGQFVQHIYDSGAPLDCEFNPGNKAFFEPFVYYVHYTPSGRWMAILHHLSPLSTDSTISARSG